MTRERRKIPALLLVWILAAVLLACPMSAVQANAATTTNAGVTGDESEDDWPSGPTESDLVAGSAILMETDTGAVVYNKNMYKKQYPASITKILTCILVLENLDMDEVVTFSEEAIYNTEGSGIARDVGEKLKVRHCVYAMMLESANECAYALAEAVAGSEEAFVEMMNEKAEELGCLNTHFSNCTGLPDEDHYTTAYDMALIAQAAYQNKKFRKIISTTTWTVPKTNKHDEKLTLYNHHAMICSNRTALYLYDYAVGGKTGYTVAAGNTLVTYAEKNDQTYVCVVLKTNSWNQYTETEDLFEFAFSKYKTVERDGDDRLSEEFLTAGYALSEDEEILSASVEGITLTLPKGKTIKDTTARVLYRTDEDGNQTGTVYYYCGDRLVGEGQVALETTLTVAAEEEAAADAGEAADETADDAETDAAEGAADTIDEAADEGTAEGAASEAGEEEEENTALTTVKNAGAKVSSVLERFSAFLRQVDLTDKVLGIPIFVYLIIVVAVILLLARIAVVRRKRKRHIEERRKRREP